MSRPINTPSTALPGALLALAALLGGCAGEMGDLERFIAETKQKHHGKVDPLPEFPPYQTFSYDASLVRDPFRPQTDLNASPVSAEVAYTGPRPRGQRRREILERFPIDSLKMVGLLPAEGADLGTRPRPRRHDPPRSARQLRRSEPRQDHIGFREPDRHHGTRPRWPQRLVNRDAKLAMSDE